jgi:tight adherence protein B
VGGVAGTVGGPVAGVVMGTYGGLATRTVLARRRTAVVGQLRVRTLDALCGLAADLRAGASPTAAWRAAGLGRLGATATATGDVQTDRLIRRIEAARRLAERTGAPLADLVEQIEADARAIGRARASATAQAAGARATAWLLAALPAGGIALGYAIGVDPLRILLHTPIGAGCAVGAGVLQLAGLAWADRLTAVDSEPTSARTGAMSDGGGRPASATLDNRGLSAGTSAGLAGSSR